MFVFPHSIRPRRPRERLFEGLFNITLIVNTACFVIAFSDFFDRQRNTFQDYFGQKINFAFSDPLKIILANCTYSGTLDVAGVVANPDVTASSAATGVLMIANLIIAIFVIHALLIVNQAASMNLYVSNVRHLRFGGAFLPIMTWLPTLNIVKAISLIALIWASKSTRDFYNGFVQSCAAKYLAEHEQNFLDAEYDTNVIFDTNFDWIFAGALLDLIVLFLAMVHHIGESFRPGYVALAKALYPWEEGAFCKVDKPLLVEWTKRRMLLMEVLKKGTAIPVSPFPQFSIPQGTPEEINILRTSGGNVMERASSIPEYVAGNNAAGGFGLRRHPSANFVNFNNKAPTVIPGAFSVDVNGDDDDPNNADAYLQDGGEEGEAYYDPGQVNDAEGDELDENDDGIADEVTEPKRRRKHRHRSDDGNVNAGEARPDGGEAEGERRHRHRRRRHHSAAPDEKKLSAE